MYQSFRVIKLHALTAVDILSGPGIIAKAFLTTFGSVAETEYALLPWSVAVRKYKVFPEVVLHLTIAYVNGMRRGVQLLSSRGKLAPDTRPFAAYLRHIR